MQGDFIEHINVINSLSPVNNNPVSAIPVRTPADLERCKALVIPGGESTSISIGIQQSGLFEAIKAFVKDAKTSGPGGKAVYGSCAGMILCSKEIEGPVSEGWLGLDGMDVKTARNAFGRQVRRPICLEVTSWANL